MNKSELESKSLADLHSLAAEAGVERYRMLPRAELVEKLAGGESGSKPERQRRESGQRRRRSGGGGGKPRQAREPRAPRESGERRGERPPREPRERPAPKPEPAAAASEPQRKPAAEPDRPKRRRRRRRWGRRRKGVRVHDLLLPAAPGRQAIVHAESREGCTALLREIAAELSAASGGPDPIALLVDPSPEELAEWRRDVPRAEIVAAGQARHADDAIAQAASRAAAGEDVIVLIDSLSRFAESYGGAGEAKALFDAGRGATGSGSLTVVAAVERP